MSDTPPVIGQDPWGADLNTYLTGLEAKIDRPVWWGWSNIWTGSPLQGANARFPWDESITPIPAGWALESPAPGYLSVPPGLYQATATVSLSQPIATPGTTVTMWLQGESGFGTIQVVGDTFDASEANDGTQYSTGSFTVVANTEESPGMGALISPVIIFSPPATEVITLALAFSVVRLGDA